MFLKQIDVKGHQSGSTFTAFADAMLDIRDHADHQYNLQWSKNVTRRMLDDDIIKLRTLVRKVARATGVESSLNPENLPWTALRSLTSAGGDFPKLYEKYRNRQAATLSRFDGEPGGGVEVGGHGKSFFFFLGESPQPRAF